MRHFHFAEMGENSQPLLLILTCNKLEDVHAILSRAYLIWLCVCLLLQTLHHDHCQGTVTTGPLGLVCIIVVRLSVMLTYM